MDKIFSSFLGNGKVTVTGSKLEILKKTTGRITIFNISDLEEIEFFQDELGLCYIKFIATGFRYNGENKFHDPLCLNLKKSVIDDIVSYFSKHLENVKQIKEEQEREMRLKEEMLRQKNEEHRLIVLNTKKANIISDLDKDNNGLIDLIDGESFNRLLNKNQKVIVEIDRNYIQKFVKISIYLKTKRNNTQKIFESIRDTVNEEELNELVSLLKNQIHTYELLVFHSISMITSLVQGDLITFYEIYECFDQLGVFNSNWENEVSSKLTDIGDGIKELMYAIYEMERSLVDSIENLTYVTQDSFDDLNKTLSLQLSEINTSLDINNLLTGIQTYQMYKINRNTKSLRH